MDLNAAVSVQPERGVRGLECLIGRGRFGIPEESVHQVIAFEVGLPPPLALPWVSGAGVHEGRLLLSIALFASPRLPRRQSKGVWLSLAGAPTDFVLEVARVSSFVEARLQSNLVTIGKNRLPAYVTAATVAGSRSIGWVHVADMLRELAGVG